MEPGDGDDDDDDDDGEDGDYESGGSPLRR